MMRLLRIRQSDTNVVGFGEHCRKSVQPIQRIRLHGGIITNSWIAFYRNNPHSKGTGTHGQSLSNTSKPQNAKRLPTQLPRWLFSGCSLPAPIPLGAKVKIEATCKVD